MGTHLDTQSKSSGFERLSLGKLCRRIRRRVNTGQSVSWQINSKPELGKAAHTSCGAGGHFFRIEDILVQKSHTCCNFGFVL